MIPKRYETRHKSTKEETRQGICKIYHKEQRSKSSFIQMIQRPIGSSTGMENHEPHVLQASSILLSKKNKNGQMARHWGQHRRKQTSVVPSTRKQGKRPRKKTMVGDHHAEENVMHLRHQSLSHADRRQKHGVEQGWRNHHRERGNHRCLHLLHLHDVAWHPASAHIELERVLLSGNVLIQPPVLGSNKHTPHEGESRDITTTILQHRQSSDYKLVQTIITKPTLVKQLYKP